MRELVIGKGYMGNSWVKCYTDGNIVIAENSKSYNLTYRDTHLTIGKDTLEGSELTDSIKNPQATSVLVRLDFIIQTNISPEEFANMLQEQYDRGYKNGEADRSEKIRRALGM